MYPAVEKALPDIEDELRVRVLRAQRDVENEMF